MMIPKNHSGKHPHESPAKEDFVLESKWMRENLTEAQIDRILQDTFPASDPPGWY